MANKEECPTFDYSNYEPILEWAKAEVAWDDTFVNGKGEKFVRPKLAHWTLLWEHGFIGFDTIKAKEDEPKARMASALFIYLWCKGIPASLADDLVAYCILSRGN